MSRHEPGWSRSRSAPLYALFILAAALLAIGGVVVVAVHLSAGGGS